MITVQLDTQSECCICSRRVMREEPVLRVKTIENGDVGYVCCVCLDKAAKECKELMR